MPTSWLPSPWADDQYGMQVTQPIQLLPGLALNPWSRQDGLTLQIANNSLSGRVDAVGMRVYKLLCVLF